eukprot:Em0016g437a
MEATDAEKKATNAVAKVTIFEDRTRKAEDAVKILQDAACISDARIAELVQTNAALEGRATRAELQIRNLTSQCRQLQEQLDKGKTPSWIVKKEDILLTDKELGRGGWGVVKAARFCGLEVAAKLLHGAILSPHNQQLFKREMNMAASVRHPNILLFIGATIDQECVILTELMQTSLRAVLEDKVTNGLSMSRQQVSNIAMDVGKALNYLHLMKPDAIIHRDVSSSNVLLEPLGAHMWIAKLSDFGSSNFARQVTTAGPGNFTYAAPESSDPDLQSPKMDVFSYGILLLEIRCVLKAVVVAELIEATDSDAIEETKCGMETCITECGEEFPVVTNVKAAVKLSGIDEVPEHSFIVVEPLISQVILRVDFVQQQGLVLDFTILRSCQHDYRTRITAGNTESRAREESNAVCRGIPGRPSLR